jgi:hypothetical protein
MRGLTKRDTARLRALLMTVDANTGGRAATGDALS